MPGGVGVGVTPRGHPPGSPPWGHPLGSSAWRWRESNPRNRRVPSWGSHARLTTHPLRCSPSTTPRGSQSGGEKGNTPSIFQWMAYA